MNFPVECLVGDPEIILDTIETLCVKNNEAAHLRLENDAKGLRISPERIIIDYMLARRGL